MVTALDGFRQPEFAYRRVIGLEDILYRCIYGFADSVGFCFGIVLAPILDLGWLEGAEFMGCSEGLRLSVVTCDTVRIAIDRKEMGKLDVALIEKPHEMGIEGRLAEECVDRLGNSLSDLAVRIAKFVDREVPLFRQLG